MNTSFALVGAKAIVTMLLLISFLQLGEAKRESLKCNPLDPERKQVLESVVERPFEGCSLTKAQTMKALRRMHWIKLPDSPDQDQVSFNFKDQRRMINKELKRAELTRPERSMVFRGFRIAAKSLNRAGTLNVSTECVMGIEPDVVALMLASSKNPNRFNKSLKKECMERGLNVETTVRSLPTVVNVVLLVRCIMWTVISFLVPFAGQVAIAIMKTITSAVVTFLPCPSPGAAVRMIDPFL